MIVRCVSVSMHGMVSDGVPPKDELIELDRYVFRGGCAADIENAGV